MQKWVQGRVVELHCWTDRLYSIRVEAEIEPFEAGQLGRLALDIDGKRHSRPYSFVNAPHEPILEFYFITVPDGPLSARLARMKAGDCVWVAPRPAGVFPLSHVPDASTLWLLSTGTALGPFLSMMNTELPWQRFDKVVFVHAVRHDVERSYGEVIARLCEQHADQLISIPFVSRETIEGTIHGRVPAAIESGELETCAGLKIDVHTSQVMICGNPAMVKDTAAVLVARGMHKNSRQEAGHYTVENYW